MRQLIAVFCCAGLLAGACISSGNPREEQEDDSQDRDGLAGLGGGSAGAASPAPSVSSTGGDAQIPGKPSSIPQIEEDCFATDPLAEFTIQQTRSWAPGSFGAVERQKGTADVVVLRDGKAFYERFDGQWQKTVDLGQPVVATLPITLVTVTLMSNGDRLDLFALGDDRQIYHRFTLFEDLNTFSARPLNGPYALWSNVREMIPGSAEVGAGSDLAAISTEPGYLDLFWWTPEGNLAHVQGQDYRWWTVSESGETRAYLRPLVASGGHLAVASPASGQFHIFAVDGSAIAHHWFDSSWNWEALHAEDFCTGDTIELTDLFATSPEANRIEIYGPSARGVRRTIVTNDLRWRSGEGEESALLFDQILIDAMPQQLGAVSQLGESSSLWTNDGTAISHFSAISSD